MLKNNRQAAPLPAVLGESACKLALGQGDLLLFISEVAHGKLVHVGAPSWRNVTWPCWRTQMAQGILAHKAGAR